MKTYRVRISKRAKRQLRQYIWYLINEKNNPQAASAVSDDYEETVKKLANVAGSLRLSEDEDLAEESIRKIFFQRHDYVILYSIEGSEARIHAIYHTKQDYENLFKKDNDLNVDE